MRQKTTKVKIIQNSRFLLTFKAFDGENWIMSVFFDNNQLYKDTLTDQLGFSESTMTYTYKGVTNSFL